MGGRATHPLPFAASLDSSLTSTSRHPVSIPHTCFSFGHGVVSTKAYKSAPLFRTLPFLPLPHKTVGVCLCIAPCRRVCRRLGTDNARVTTQSSHGLRWSPYSFSLSCIRRSKTGKLHITAPHMHVTACLAGQQVDMEVGENCRTLQALKEAVVEALPKLCVEGFDVSVGGRALDNDEGVLSLEESVRLDVSANSRGLSVLALREAGRAVGEAGLLAAAAERDVALCTLYLDAGVPIDCTDARGCTPLFNACNNGNLEIARLLLDRGSTAIDEKNSTSHTPLLRACDNGHLEIATLLLDRGSTAIDEKDRAGYTPLLYACWGGHLEIATLLLDRGCTAIDEKDRAGYTPLLRACDNGHLEIATLLLDRGSTAIDEKDSTGYTPLLYACWGGHLEIATLLLDRGCSVDVEEYEAMNRCFPQEVLEHLSEMVSRPSRPRTI